MMAKSVSQLLWERIWLCSSNLSQQWAVFWIKMVAAMCLLSLNVAWRLCRFFSKADEVLWMIDVHANIFPAAASSSRGWMQLQLMLFLGCGCHLFCWYCMSSVAKPSVVMTHCLLSLVYLILLGLLSCPASGCSQFCVELFQLLDAPTICDPCFASIQKCREDHSFVHLELCR